MSRTEKQPYSDQVTQLRQQLLKAAQEPQSEKIIVNQNLAASIFSQPQEKFFQKLEDNNLFVLITPKDRQAQINLLLRSQTHLPESISDLSRLASEKEIRGIYIRRWYQEVYGGLQTQNWDQVSSAYNHSVQSLKILHQHHIINLSNAFLDSTQNIQDYQSHKDEQLQQKYPHGYISGSQEASSYLTLLFNYLKNNHPEQKEILKRNGLIPEYAVQTLTTTSYYPDF